MCIKARFLIKKLRHFTGNFSSIFHYSKPIFHIQAYKNLRLCKVKTHMSYQASKFELIQAQIKLA